ncbi:unnamed protein product [Closterium sp. Naga37s-1]|nr:unnamed protein product [Closterium sp. Naga37s-1]
MVGKPIVPAPTFILTTTCSWRTAAHDAQLQVLTRDFSTTHTAAAPLQMTWHRLQQQGAHLLLLSRGRFSFRAAVGARPPPATADDLSLLQRSQRLAHDCSALIRRFALASAVADDLARVCCCIGGGHLLLQLDVCSTCCSWRGSAAASDALEQRQQRLACGSSTTSSWQAAAAPSPGSTAAAPCGTRLHLRAFSVVTRWRTAAVAAAAAAPGALH